MERKIKLKTLNVHITCKICRGYLVDATTVTECLHTFCKSCVVKHLEENNTCPSCQIVIHQSHPLQYISFDRTMQDIVYKLVPNLQENELKRERDFYRARGLPCPKDIPLNAGPEGEAVDEKPPTLPQADSDFHRLDEQVRCSPFKSYHPITQKMLTFYNEKELCKLVLGPEEILHNSGLDLMINLFYFKL
jgi:polycomb group RING finger protein 3